VRKARRVPDGRRAHQERVVQPPPPLLLVPPLSVLPVLPVLLQLLRRGALAWDRLCTQRAGMARQGMRSRISRARERPPACTGNTMYKAAPPCTHRCTPGSAPVRAGGWAGRTPCSASTGRRAPRPPSAAPGAPAPAGALSARGPPAALRLPARRPCAQRACRRHNHAQRQARQTLVCAPGAPASARACPPSLAAPDLPAAASRRRARAAGSCRRPPPRAPRAPARPASSPCAAAPPTAAAPGAPAGDGAAASKLAAAPGASMRAPGAAVWSDAAGAGALGSRLLSARRGGHATRSTSCEKVSRPRSAPYTVVACRARRGGLPWA